MIALTEVYCTLAQEIAADPLLRLAATVATFDPFWNALDDDAFDEDRDPLTAGLLVARTAFPDIYADAIVQMRTGASADELERLLCQAISAKSIPLHDLDMIGWGIPLDAVGIDLEDPDFYAAHADLQPVLALFGIRWPDDDAGRVDLPDEIYPVGRAIAASLLEQNDSTLRQVGWLCSWLFSCTGNSLVDYNDEALAEIPPLSWSAEDVAFAIELIEEADGIMADVQVGLAALNTNPTLQGILERNITIARKHALRKGNFDEHRLRLDWAGTGVGSDGTAISDFSVPLVRDHAA